MRNYIKNHVYLIVELLQLTSIILGIVTGVWAIVTHSYLLAILPISYSAFMIYYAVLSALYGMKIAKMESEGNINDEVITMRNLFNSKLSDEYMLQIRKNMAANQEKERNHTKDIQIKE